jgi:very-short-patch-repair endonuclease
MTSSEKLLWKVLRRKSISGFKFLRQHPIFYRIDKEWIEFFIADFYCAKLKLIIELDGEVHRFRKEYDYDRDQKLLNKGIYVVRIKNDVLEDLNKATILMDEIIGKHIIQMS